MITASYHGKGRKNKRCTKGSKKVSLPNLSTRKINSMPKHLDITMTIIL